MTDKADLTSGSVATGLLRIGGPMVFGLAAVLSQSLVDAFFVGKLGTDQLAALSFTFPVSLAFTSLSIGLSAGASSVVSRVVGNGDANQARCLAADSLLLAFAVVTALAILGLVTIEPLFTALGASEDVMEYVMQYMPIWYLSVPFLIVGIVGHGVMRANGEGTWPSVIMVGGALVNVVLTPVLMYGWWLFPKLNIEGVALATLISRILNVAVTLAALYFVRRMIRYRLPGHREIIESSRRLLKIALPAAAGNVVNPVGIGIVTALLAVFGETTVAAFGVATRLEAFACLPMLALSSAIGPFAGQNWGAGCVERVVSALKLSYLLCFVTCLVLVGVFQMFGKELAGLLASDAAVAAETVDYLHIVALSLWGYGLVIVTASAFNGIGKSTAGFGYYALRMLVLYVPLSWLATLIAQERAVFIAIAVSNALAGAISGFIGLWWLSRHTQSDAQAEGPAESHA